MQLNIFDIETPTPQLACEKPTRKNPNGRTGTSAGVQAHYAAKEDPCDECAQYNRERARANCEKKRDSVLASKRAHYEANPGKYKICEKPTRKYPEGRTGTTAGYDAHRKEAKETACQACSDANYKYKNAYYLKNADSVKASKREYYAKNREEILSYNAEYYVRNKDRIIERTAAWQKANPEKMATYRRKWLRENPEKRRKSLEKYRKENPDKVREPQRRYYAENRDSIAAYDARYRETHKEQIQKWFDDNKGHLAEYRRKYYLDNRPSILAYQKQYAELNQDKVREYSRAAAHRRRARLAGLPFEPYTAQDVTETHGTMCYLCNTEVDLEIPPGSALSPHIDHVHPIAREGCPGDILSNTSWTHALCNVSKNDRLVSELDLPFPAPQWWSTDLLEHQFQYQ